MENAETGNNLAISNFGKMKTKIRLSFCVLISLLFILASCIGKIERDANEMADLVRQRRDFTILLLKSNDSATSSQYQEKLLLLERKYSDLKNELEKNMPIQ